MNIVKGVHKILRRLPSSIYLGISVLIFASSNSITRKIVAIGQAHAINGRNPISLCNVLFVGNICALGLMTLIFYQDWKPNTLKALTRKDWISLTITGILSGAIAPALIFTALGQTNITNIVLIGRIEPILTLILGFWLLGSRVDFWASAGALISLAGVIVTAFLGSSGQTMTMAGFQIGTGEIFVAIAAIIGSIATVVGKLQLQSVPLGIFTIYRNILGTVIFFLLANLLPLRAKPFCRSVISFSLAMDDSLCGGDCGHGSIMLVSWFEKCDFHGTQFSQFNEPNCSYSDGLFYFRGSSYFSSIFRGKFIVGRDCLGFCLQRISG